MSYIELKKISKSFGEKEVIKNFDLSIDRGEFISLLGPSGCGKTTLLRMVAGFIDPTEGEIIIDGRTVFSSEKNIYVKTGKRNLGMVFQSYAVWPHMTVYENVAYPLKIKKLPKEEENPYEGALTFALLGRPNVGKSSLANRLLGYERVIVSPVSGTTRDSVDIQFEKDGRKYVMVDTAGIKRPGKVDEDLDRFAVIRSADAARRADICLLLIDAEEGLVSQDIHVSSYAMDYNKPIIIVVNKWDLHSHGMDDQQKFAAEVRAYFKFASFAPIVFCSAKTGSNIKNIFKELEHVYETIHKKVPSSLLNSLITKAQLDNEAPDFNGGRLRISYCTQSDDVPPTFVLFVNNPNYFHFSYKRYLENAIRKEFGFDCCPINLLIRSKRAYDLMGDRK